MVRGLAYLSVLDAGVEKSVATATVPAVEVVSKLELFSAAALAHPIVLSIA